MKFTFLEFYKIGMKKLLIVIFFVPFFISAQPNALDQELFDGYETFKESSLAVRRVKHDQIQPLIDKIKNKNGFQVTKLGSSIEGRKISMISMGTGDIDIMLWSQMHGDEPTATLAIFDILNFLVDESVFKLEKEKMLSSSRLHFIPMLNPDGAELYKRRNALDIDINRDALSLQSPEGRILKAARDSLDADFGFNLHDQSTYYNTERTDKPATISYLAPAYNYEKDINGVRGNAMKVIVLMNNIIQKYAPGQVGRYSDDFEPRAFGDNIQKWGTSAILIESGGYANDPEKQFIRKLNYITLLTAMFSISDGAYEKTPIEDYEKIPNNDRKFFDLKIENMTYSLLEKDYTIDVGIHLFESDDATHNNFHYIGKVTDMGDLSTFYGYQTLDATGLRYNLGKKYDKKLPNISALKIQDLKDILSKGYTHIQLDDMTGVGNYSSIPINLTLSNSPVSETLQLGSDATFYLSKDDLIKYVIVNGFVFDGAQINYGIKNGVIR
jgi:hypothetical protein